MALPIADWQAALAEMEAGLASALAALDRYQAAWGGVIDAPPASGGEIDRVEDRLQEWDVRLKAAADLAESVGRELDDREAAVGRCRALYSDWQQVIQRGVTRNPSPTPPRNGEGLLPPLPSEGRGPGG